MSGSGCGNGSRKISQSGGELRIGTERSFTPGAMRRSRRSQNDDRPLLPGAGIDRYGPVRDGADLGDDESHDCGVVFDGGDRFARGESIWRCWQSDGSDLQAQTAGERWGRWTDKRVSIQLDDGRAVGGRGGSEIQVGERGYRNFNVKGTGRIEFDLEHICERSGNSLRRRLYGWMRTGGIAWRML